MKSLVAVFAVLFSLGSLFAQTTAERLGYSKEDRLLIIHADDIGVAHSVNRASFDSFEKGIINSGSAMVPCPWFPDVAQYARENENHDIGLHLTLTAEWKDYRWDGQLPSTEISSLIDEDGYLPRETAPIRDSGKLEEVRKEIEAQVERSLELGLKPTHLDSHMGTLFQSPELVQIYFETALKYGIPALLPRIDLENADPNLLMGIESKMPLIDKIEMAGEKVYAENWFDFYADIVRNLKPGITEIIIHVGYDDSELQAVMEDHPDYGSEWRQRDFDVFNSEGIKALIKEQGIKMITWREIGTLMN